MREKNEEADMRYLIPSRERALDAHWRASLYALVLLSASCLGAIGCDTEDDLTAPATQTVAGDRSSGGEVSGGEMSGEEAGEEAGERGGEDSLPLTPIEGCLGSLDTVDIGANQSADPQECVTCEGSQAPNFKLRDLSPTSCGVGKYYGLDALQGMVTFVVLLRSTCGYCHLQLEALERMRFELIASGHLLNMVVINQVNTQETVELLTQRSQIPVLQDVPEVDAWGALSDLDEVSGERIGGDKDDMYIYDADGALWRFLDDDDPAHKLNLSTDEGYQYLKDALIEAVEAQ